MGFLINGLVYILSYNFKKFIGFNLPVSDIIIYGIMIYIVVYKVRKYNKLDDKERRNFYINLLPILGVIGTFLGICLGLANFDSNEIESSVPQLLQGLKTAFWTSFIGTSWAVFLNMRYSSIDKEENDEEDEISLLKSQNEELKKLNTNFYNLFEENKKEKNSLYEINREMLDSIKANNNIQEQLLQIENLKAIKEELNILNKKQDNRDEILNKLLDSLNNSKLILENIVSFKELLKLITDKQDNKNEQITIISNKLEGLEKNSISQIELLKKVEEYTFVLDDIHNRLEELKEKSDTQTNQLENLEKLNILDELKNNIDSQLEEISVSSSNISTKLNNLGILDEIKKDINSQLERISIINSNLFAKLESLEKYDSNVFANSLKSIELISLISEKVEDYKNTFNNFIDNSNKQNSELLLAFKEFSSYMVEENSKAFIEALNKTIKDFNINLVETFGSNFKLLNEAVVKLLDWQENYKDTIEITTENQRTILNSFRNIENELDNFNEKTKGVSTVVSELALATKEAVEQNYRLNDSLEVIAQLDNQVKELLPNFMKLNYNLDNNLKVFTEQTDTINKELKEFTTNLSSSFDKSISKINDTVVKVDKSLEDMINSFSVTIEKSEENNSEIVRSTSNKIKLLNDELDRNLKEKIQEIDDSLKDNLNDIIKMLAKISEKFAEDYEPLANKLRDIVQLPNLIENDKKVK